MVGITRARLRAVVWLNAHLEAIAVRLTRITGKSRVPIHPKHLVNVEIYYAGRVSNPLRLDDVVSELDEPRRMREFNTHYLVLRGTEPVGPTGSMQPTCIVLERGEPSLLIYDLWEEPDTTEVVIAEELRPVFYSEYATWQNLRPFLAVGSEERAL